MARFFHVNAMMDPDHSDTGILLLLFQCTNLDRPMTDKQPRLSQQKPISTVGKKSEIENVYVTSTDIVDHYDIG